MLIRTIKTVVPWLGIVVLAAACLLVIAIADSARKTLKRANADYRIRPYE